MYAYIKGSLEIKGNDYVVIENNGIGYKIFAPITTINKYKYVFLKKPDGFRFVRLFSCPFVCSATDKKTTVYNSY